MGYGTSTGPVGHVHSYSGSTFSGLGRVNYSGDSSAAYGGVDAHTHTLQGAITPARGPEYSYSIVTGPGIPAGRDQHVHSYSGVVKSQGRGPGYRLSGITLPAKNDPPKA